MIGVDARLTDQLSSTVGGVVAAGHSTGVRSTLPTASRRGTCECTSGMRNKSACEARGSPGKTLVRGSSSTLNHPSDRGKDFTNAFFRPIERFKQE